MTPFTTKELAAAGEESIDYWLDHAMDNLREILKRLVSKNQRIKKKDMPAVICCMEQIILRGMRK